MLFLLNLLVIPQYTIFCTKEKNLKKLVHFDMNFIFLHRIQKCWSI